MRSGDVGCRRDFVKLSVADTGCGMPPEVLARAFEPFFTTKDVGKGSGLGLPQVYGFAQQSGGRVSIDSKVGAGTIVTLLLPRSLQRPVAAQSGRRIEPHRSRRRRRAPGHVLLVEDDKEVVGAHARDAESASASPSFTSRAPTRRWARSPTRAPIDIVLSDIMMPGGVSGLELAREIRRRHPSLPIVLTTGYAEAAAGMESTEFRLLLKPYTLDALADALIVDSTLSAS